jgi:hypothetical protein
MSSATVPAMLVSGEVIPVLGPGTPHAGEDPT